jgi:hypothetical protein
MRGELVVLALALLLDAPGAKLHVHPAYRSAGLAESAAADPFLGMELAGADVADGEMGEVEIAHTPVAIRLRGLELDALTKNRELVAEAVVLCIAEVAGEIPPLALERRMRAVIAWE